MTRIAIASDINEILELQSQNLEFELMNQFKTIWIDHFSDDLLHKAWLEVQADKLAGIVKTD
jgi:hypothetical protein